MPGHSHTLGEPADAGGEGWDPLGFTLDEGQTLGMESRVQGRDVEAETVGVGALHLPHRQMVLPAKAGLNHGLQDRL